MGRGLTGINPLKYRGVRPGTPPNMVIFKRRPTIKDYIEYEIGDLWVIPKRAPDAPTTDPSKEVWILVSKRYQQGIWIRFRFGGNTPTGAGYIITEYNTPGATGNHTLDEQTQLVELYAWGAGCSGSGGNRVWDGLGGAFGYGGGAGGFMHWQAPASLFGGGGASVAYSVAPETPGGIAPTAGSNGGPSVRGASTVFGGMETPINERVASLAEAANGTLNPENFLAYGQGVVDNTSSVDPFTHAAFANPSTWLDSLMFNPAYFAMNFNYNVNGGIADPAAFYALAQVTGHPHFPGGGGFCDASSAPNISYPGNSVGDIKYNIIAQGGAIGANGANGGNGTGYYIAGAGGGAGAVGGGNGGDGGWPGGGGGGGGSDGATRANGGVGGKGAGGRLIVIEYLG